MIRSVVFDLYDTLIYIERRIEQTYTAEILGNFAAARDIILTHSLNSYEIAQMLKTDADEFSRLVTQECESARVFPDALPTLRQLRKAGLTIGLVSNLASPYIQPFYDLGLDSYVDFLVFSCMVGNRKPDPEIYSLVLDGLGVAPNDILFVGNSLRSDYEGPRACGFRSLLLDRQKIVTGSEIERIYSLSDILLHLGISEEY